MKKALIIIHILLIVFSIILLSNHSVFGQRDAIIYEICEGDSIELQIPGTWLSFSWASSSTLSNDTIPNPIAFPTETTEYYATVLFIDTVNELIVNGDFSQGTIGFNSDYTYKIPGSGVEIEGEYTISSDPSQEHYDFVDCPDHTSGTGNMMIVNGDSSAMITVWEEFILTGVTPYTDYAFSTWIETVVDRPYSMVNPAILQFWVNNVLLGEGPFEANWEYCIWEHFYEIWNSGPENRATIRIVNQNLEPGGNDFALDDISFAPIVSKVDTFRVIVNPLPVVDLGNDTTVSIGSDLTIDAGFPGASFLWNTGETTQTITLTNITDNQSVGVNVTYDGCTGFGERWVGVGCTVELPTAFSPNGDRQNDLLYIRGSGYSEVNLMIFNRQGEMVFQTQDASIPWDGTYKNADQGMDAYMYYLEARCISGEQVERKGSITLLR